MTLSWLSAVVYILNESKLSTQDTFMRWLIDICTQLDQYSLTSGKSGADPFHPNARKSLSTIFSLLGKHFPQTVASKKVLNDVCSAAMSKMEKPAPDTRKTVHTH